MIQSLAFQKMEGRDGWRSRFTVGRSLRTGVPPEAVACSDRLRCCGWASGGANRAGRSPSTSGALCDSVDVPSGWAIPEIQYAM